MQGRYDAGIAEPLRRFSTKGGERVKKFFWGDKNNEPRDNQVRKEKKAARVQGEKVKPRS